MIVGGGVTNGIRGSTGPIKATAGLLFEIARLSKGAVVLPGLDLDMDDESWSQIDAVHPQYGMKELLIRMEVAREDVTFWSDGGDHVTTKSQARRRLINEALRIHKAALPDDHAMLAHARSVLGECLTALGRYDEAEPLVLESYERLQAVLGESGTETRKALPRIVKLYEAWDASEPNQGYAEKAAEWRAKLPKEETAEATPP